MQLGVSSFTFGWAANNTDPAINPPFSFDSVLAFAVDRGQKRILPYDGRL